MPTPKKKAAKKRPAPARKKAGRRKKAARQKGAARDRRKKAARRSPSKTAKAKRSASRKRGKKKPAEPVVARPNSDLLAQVTVPESSPGAGDGVPSFEDRYLEAIALGLKKKERAFFAGCDPSTPREWDELALEDFEAGRETVFTRFYIKVRQAETGRIADGLKMIVAARKAGDWRAAAWELERSGYGAPPKQINVQGSLQTGSFPTDEQDDEIAASVITE